MKAVYGIAPKKTILKELPEPEIKNPKQVLIKLRYCGVCMSEHYDWLSDGRHDKPFGHEPVGVVEAVGDQVTRCKVGDRVSGAFSGAAEYALTTEEKVFVIPDNVSDTDAILEPLSCLISAVSKVRISFVGEKIAVVGCGYMGCGAISLLKMRGAYVVAVDIRRECLEDAKRYGADETYTPDELPAEYFDRPGNNLGFQSAGFGFPLVMEWGETNESLDLAIRMTRMCGQLAIGAYHTGEKRLVDMQQLNVKAIDCLSTHPREHDFNLKCYTSAVKMLGDGSWCFKNVPTKVYPITMYDRAHEELTSKYGKYMKAVVDFTRTDFEPYIIE